MTDWKTYAKAARNTARRQSESARDSARTYATAARRTAARQAPEARRSMNESAQRARDTATAYAAVSRQRARRMQLGRRLKAALRDALIMGACVGVLWFVITRTGAQIPVPILLAVIAVLMVVRFGYALIARHDDIAQGVQEREEREADAFPRR